MRCQAQTWHVTEILSDKPADVSHLTHNLSSFILCSDLVALSSFLAEGSVAGMLLMFGRHYSDRYHQSPLSAL